MSQANQDAIEVELNGDTINIVADVDDLNEFASTNSSQGTGKWIGLAIDTGEDSIIGVKFNGAEMGAADVAEAASVGYGAGWFVLWLKAESIFPKTITLSKEGKVDKTITIELN